MVRMSEQISIKALAEIANVTPKTMMERIKNLQEMSKMLEDNNLRNDPRIRAIAESSKN